MEGEGMSEKLKPCPFCGGKASMESGRYEMDDDMFSFAHVECLSCGACGSGFTEAEKPVESLEALAADAWNRRAERTCRMSKVFVYGAYKEYPDECYECTECGYTPEDENPSYCPNCGAKVVDDD